MPARSSPRPSRLLSTRLSVRMPWARPAAPAATGQPTTIRDAYGVPMPTVDGSGPAIDPILQKVLDAVPFQLSADEGVEVAPQRLGGLPRRAFYPEPRVENRTI